MTGSSTWIQKTLAALPAIHALRYTKDRSLFPSQRLRPLRDWLNQRGMNFKASSFFMPMEIFSSTLLALTVLTTPVWSLNSRTKHAFTEKSGRTTICPMETSKVTPWRQWTIQWLAMQRIGFLVPKVFWRQLLSSEQQTPRHRISLYSIEQHFWNCWTPTQCGWLTHLRSSRLKLGSHIIIQHIRKTQLNSLLLSLKYWTKVSMIFLWKNSQRVSHL